MNFQFYVEKLLGSEDFKKFKNEHKEAFPASAFFVIDKQGSDNKQHFDYFVPEENKMFSFKLEDDCKMVPVEMVDTSTLSKSNTLAMNYSFDFDDVERKIANEMGIRKMKNQVQKILISIQRKNNKDFALCTVFISGMGLLKVMISLEDMRVIDFEKKSFMDFLKMGKGKGQ